jgi:hypothetical protein
MSYNGWTNYETWAVKLWLDNEQGDQEMMEEIVRENTKDWIAGEVLRDTLAEYMPDLDGTLWGDLLSSAWEGVNWREIAENVREDLSEA